MVALSSSASAAGAQARATCTALAVAQDPGATRVAVQLGALLESSLRRNGAFAFVDVADVADPGGAERRFSVAQDASEAFAKAREAYDGLEFEGAADHARRAALLASNGPLVDRREALSGALLLGAAARYYAGDEPAARAEFSALHAVDAGAWMDPVAWSPELLAVSLDEKFRLLPLRKGAARVETRPGPARIYVDGVFVGISPLTLRGLTPGAHRVTAQAPFFELADGTVDFSGALTLTLRRAAAGSELEALGRKLSDSFGNPDGDEALLQLGRAAGTAQLLVARVEGAGGEQRVRVVRVSAADGRLLGESQGPLALDSTAGLVAADKLVRAALRDR
jgi:hypothetical protein